MLLSSGSGPLILGPLVCAPLGLVRPMTIRAMMTRPITSCVKVARADLQTAKGCPISRVEVLPPPD